MLVREALADAVSVLQNSPAASDDPHLVARLLMKHCLGVETSGLLMRAEDHLITDEETRFFETIKRARTEPVFRVIGAREFHGLEFGLNASTLEPRDDTEALIECVLQRVDAAPEGRSEAWRFADLGTGTGAIALALLSELPNAHAMLTDLSQDALDMARRNAEQNGLARRCTFLQGSWLEPLMALEGPSDFIVSNPPYIASDVVDTLDSVVRDHDPRVALDGGADGLNAYRVLVEGARLHLSVQGFLAVEIGYDQAASVTELAEAAGWRCEGPFQDLGGRDRALVLT